MYVCINYFTDSLFKISFLIELGLNQNNLGSPVLFSPSPHHPFYFFLLMDKNGVITHAITKVQQYRLVWKKKDHTKFFNFN